jgi:hypothetical protein
LEEWCVTGSNRWNKTGFCLFCICYNSQIKTDRYFKNQVELFQIILNVINIF